MHDGELREHLLRFGVLESLLAHSGTLEVQSENVDSLVRGLLDLVLGLQVVLDLRRLLDVVERPGLLSLVSLLVGSRDLLGDGGEDSLRVEEPSQPEGLGSLR